MSESFLTWECFGPDRWGTPWQQATPFDEAILVDIDVESKRSGPHSACAGFAHGEWDTTAFPSGLFNGSAELSRRRLVRSQAVKQRFNVGVVRRCRL